MLKPVAWIGQDAFAALLGGETICQTMTPSQAMYDDVPLTVIPPGFAVVPVSLLKLSNAMLLEWSKKYGEHNPQWLPPAHGVELAEEIDAAITAAAKGK